MKKKIIKENKLLRFTKIKELEFGVFPSYDPSFALD